MTLSRLKHSYDQLIEKGGSRMNERNYAVVVCGYNEMANLPRCVDGLIHTVNNGQTLFF
jgi:hypothetical protein